MECCTIWKYCLPLAWSFLGCCTYLLPPSWNWAVSSWVHPAVACILCSFCPGKSHGLYCCSCCFSHCPGYSFMGIHLFTCHYVNMYYFTYICLCETFTLTPCSISCLLEDSTSWFLDLSLLLYCESISVYVHVCVIICRVIVHSSRLYTWCLLTILIIWCWVH